MDLKFGTSEYIKHSLLSNGGIVWRFDSIILIIIWAIFNIVSTVGSLEQHTELPQMSLKHARPSC